MTRALALLALVLAGCGQGSVSNDDSVSRTAAERVVERFFQSVHDGRENAACQMLPPSQRAGLAHLFLSRGGTESCAGALRSLREFAPARRPGGLAIHHDMGFRGSLPHRSKAAVDEVTINGTPVGAVGLRRRGDTWSLAVVCDCPG